VGGVDGDVAGFGQLRRLAVMDRPVLELVHPADVIAVDVGGDGQQLVVQLVLDEVAQRPQPE
jgi:hypothetical protein